MCRQKEQHVHDQTPEANDGKKWGGGGKQQGLVNSQKNAAPKKLMKKKKGRVGWRRRKRRPHGVFFHERVTRIGRGGTCLSKVYRNQSENL